MEFDNLFNSLYNMAKGLILVMGEVWNWLTNPIEIDVPLLSDIPLIGSWFEWSLDYSPLEFLGVGIGLLLVLWFVKNLIPVG